MTAAITLTKPAQIRVARRSPAYWRVTIDNPPINVMGSRTGSGIIWAKSRARPALRSPDVGNGRRSGQCICNQHRIKRSHQ